MKRVVGWSRAVRVDAQNLAEKIRQGLRVAAVRVLAPLRYTACRLPTTIV